MIWSESYEKATDDGTFPTEKAYFGLVFRSSIMGVLLNFWPMSMRI